MVKIWTNLGTCPVYGARLYRIDHGKNEHSSVWRGSRKGQLVIWKQCFGIIVLKSKNKSTMSTVNLSYTWEQSIIPTNRILIPDVTSWIPGHRCLMRLPPVRDLSLPRLRPASPGRRVCRAPHIRAAVAGRWCHRRWRKTPPSPGSCGVGAAEATSCGQIQRRGAVIERRGMSCCTETT